MVFSIPESIQGQLDVLDVVVLPFVILFCCAHTGGFKTSNLIDQRAAFKLHSQNKQA